MTAYLTTDTDLTAVADAIREKGGTSAALQWPGGYVNAIDAIETGGGGGGDSGESMSDPIRFFDYDGSLVASYKSVPSSLPSNPSHNGLIAQGWNYTLAQIQTQFTATGTCDIGQMYITESGDTEIDVSMPDGRLSPYLNLAPNGTVTIDWGDNSSTNTLTGISLTTYKGVQHVYTVSGNYTIRVHVVSGSVALFGTSAYTLLYKTATGNNNRVYSNCVLAVRVGANTSIGNYAFTNCYSLASVTIPDSVTSIGTYAFASCPSLASVTIPDGVTSIGINTFQYCYSLASVAIPDGVTSIGNNAFQNCHSLASVTIPDSVTSIGTYAFASCNSLASFTIPDGMTSISNYMFQGCYALASVAIPDSVTSIGSHVFYNCLSLASVAIPDGVTSIGNYAFYYCFGLASVTIPDGVKSIGSYVFQYCNSLVSVNIPDGVTSIGNYAFQYCPSLASVTIPDSVTSIGSNVFNACYGLGEIHFLSTTPPTVANSNAWNSVPTDCKIYVPTGSLTTYTSAAKYPSSSTYTYIEE